MRRIVLLVALAALVALLASATTAPARPAAALEHRGTLAQDVIDELNRVRAARGLPRLRSQAGLRAAANEHSHAMLVAGFFAHESPDGTPFHNRIRKHYPSRGWQRWSVGETLLSSGGTLEARAIVAAWLDSPSHRQILLTPGWRKVGIGAVGRVNAAGAGVPGSLAVTADFGLREK
jgi:uncharacterized protein YkwD